MNLDGKLLRDGQQLAARLQKEEFAAFDIALQEIHPSDIELLQERGLREILSVSIFGVRGDPLLDPGFDPDEGALDRDSIRPAIDSKGLPNGVR